MVQWKLSRLLQSINAEQGKIATFLPEDFRSFRKERDKACRLGRQRMFAECSGKKRAKLTPQPSRWAYSSTAENRFGCFCSPFLIHWISSSAIIHHQSTQWASSEIRAWNGMSFKVEHFCISRLPFRFESHNTKGKGRLIRNCETLS